MKYQELRYQVGTKYKFDKLSHNIYTYIQNSDNMVVIAILCVTFKTKSHKNCMRIMFDEFKNIKSNKIIYSSFLV